MQCTQASTRCRAHGDRRREPEWRHAARSRTRSHTAERWSRTPGSPRNATDALAPLRAARGRPLRLRRWESGITHACVAHAILWHSNPRQRVAHTTVSRSTRDRYDLPAPWAAGWNVSGPIFARRTNRKLLERCHWRRWIGPCSLAGTARQDHLFRQYQPAQLLQRWKADVMQLPIPATPFSRNRRSDRCRHVPACRARGAAGGPNSPRRRNSPGTPGCIQRHERALLLADRLLDRGRWMWQGEEARGHQRGWGRWIGRLRCWRHACSVKTRSAGCLE
jgi:hypothetical protein